MTTLAEKIAVMQAAENGATIQARSTLRPASRPESPWEDTDRPVWDWCSNEYRVKPKPLERWINVYPDGLLSMAYESANKARELSHGALRTAVHMREVIE